jgi:hypothetical protein
VLEIRASLIFDNPFSVKADKSRNFSHGSKQKVTIPTLIQSTLSVMVYRENVLLYNINKDLRKTKVINIENNVQNLVRVGYLRL